MTKFYQERVECCADCRYYRYLPWHCTHEGFCGKKGGPCWDSPDDGIPDWCPLPDVEEQSELGKALESLLEEEGAEEVLNWAKNEYPEFIEAAKDMTPPGVEEGE